MKYKGSIRIAIAAALLFLQLKCFATVTINIDAERLKTASGDPMPITGLVLLVASTNDLTFAPPTSDSFVTGDDIIVAKFNLSAFDTPGVLSDILQGAVLAGGW